MDSLKTIWREFIGLFIDDGRLSVAVLLWLAVNWLALPRLELPPPWPPVALFVGLALILGESALRRAGQRK
jgi:hypothetical protein